MITKETIAQYCVDSKGDKALAEQIARQFERAGFERDASFCVDVLQYPFIGITRDFEINNSYAPPESCTISKEATETTLSELTKMVDELMGDEYQIVREFIEFQAERLLCCRWTFTNLIEQFKKYRVKRTVTLQDLKEAYAEKMGIDVDKIVVKEETK